MRAIVGRMRRKRGRWLKGMQPLVDLWVGGPGADGRGLDAANGGYDPAPGLQIVSPSGSTPSSSARFLIRDAGGKWRDKRPGVLAGIGGRVWTGDGWTYNGAKEVTFLGPLPVLSTHGVTDTVRRYPGGSGYTVQDAPGGIVQPYSQRVDVNEGVSGEGYSVWPAEIVSSVGHGDQVYWHGIVETSTPQLFAPVFGAYSDGFFGGNTPIPAPLSQEQAGQSGEFAWDVRHRGIGPNGGLVVEYFVRQRITQNKSNVGLFAYLLNAYGAPQARTIYIHQAAAHRLPYIVGRIFDMPTFALVANGSQASLIKEDIVFGGEQTNVTLVARMDLRKYNFIGHGYRVFAYAVDDGYTPLQISTSVLSAHPPLGTYGNVVADLVTLAVAIGSDRVCYGYRDGVYQNALPLNAPAGTAPNYRIGRYSSSDSRTLLVPYHRLLVFPRAFDAERVLKVHQEIVRAEALL